MEFLIFLLFIFYLGLLIGAVCLWVWVARKFEAIAYLKGYGTSYHTFAMCFWLGIVGMIYVLALPNLFESGDREKIIKLLSQKTQQEHTNTNA